MTKSCKIDDANHWCPHSVMVSPNGCLPQYNVKNGIAKPLPSSIHLESHWGKKNDQSKYLGIHLVPYHHEIKSYNLLKVAIIWSRKHGACPWPSKHYDSVEQDTVCLLTAASHGPAAEWELQLTTAKSLRPKKSTLHIATPGKKPNSNEEGGFQWVHMASIPKYEEA